MEEILRESETHKNLMRAFAGESQARNRYTFAASFADKQGMNAVARVFLFTAEQELAHAKVFFDFLKTMSGENVFIDAGYPVESYESLEAVLDGARHNEYEEYESIYKSFAEAATREGFTAIAAAFESISEIEKIHGDRFNMLLEKIKGNELFVSNTQTGWFCTNCGYIFNGMQAPPKCPVCSHDRGYFITLDLVPYTPECLMKRQG